MVNNDENPITAEDTSPELGLDLQPTARCDSCGTFVAAAATGQVPRLYLNKVFKETWCNLCIESMKEATRRSATPSTDDDPDY
jgi:hypothetical protein